jgi:hypothetical protein
MATKIYDTDTITLLDGTDIVLSPLKIKFLREFMDVFEFVKTSRNDKEAVFFMTECARVAMKQYYPQIATTDQLEDAITLPMMYKILDVSAGIKIGGQPEDTVKKKVDDSKSDWESLDLAKLESEAFLIGIWKDYSELESSLSMPELLSTLTAKRELDYEEKKFLAGIQGVDLDEATGSSGNEWEEMKARVFSRGNAANSNDVVALQGQNAINAGFGIGMGLDYERIN